MTRLLEEAFEKLKGLPAREQDEMAKMILDEITWESSFANSQDELSKMANEALEEYKAGKTKPFDIESNQ